MSKFVFGNVPILKKRRSRFNLNQPVKTTMDVGKLYPIYCQEIYPGDSFKVNTAVFARTPIPFSKVPIDNLFMDIAFYFVPNRLTFDKWKELMGENNATKWTQSTTYTTPTVNVPNNLTGAYYKTVASYFGIPKTTVGGLTINALPFRALGLIWNYWWRDQNNIDPVLVNVGTTDGTINTNAWASNNYLGQCPPVCKLHDYFTTCLPGTQKGTAPSLPLAGTAPVKTANTDLFVTGSNSLRVRKVGSGGTIGAGDVLANCGSSGTIANVGAGVSDGTITIASTDKVYPTNLYADLNAASAGATINDLRLNVQIQKLYELDARAGTRYPESVFSHFGVGTDDGVQQIPQFLGGKRFPLNIQGISQTSSNQVVSDEEELDQLVSPLGSFSGTCISAGFSGYSKSFSEHGFVIGVACIRYLHTYQQGIERFWSRSNRLSYYDPLFAHLGEQAVYKKELDITHSGYNDVFGYQEAFADLRYRPALITGGLNMGNQFKGAAQLWHFGDWYDSIPVLGADFIKETELNVGRTIANMLYDETAYDMPMFIVDLYHKVKAIRVLPTYGTPGLVDHM